MSTLTTDTNLLPGIPSEEVVSEIFQRSGSETREEGSRYKPSLTQPLNFKNDILEVVFLEVVSQSPQSSVLLLAVFPHNEGTGNLSIEAGQ